MFTRFAIWKMAVREKPIEEREWTQHDSNFTFYLTHPVTVNTSTVTYLTQLVAAENVEVVKCKGRTISVFMLL
jgi:hypothetical protein